MKATAAKGSKCPTSPTTVSVVILPTQPGPGDPDRSHITGLRELQPSGGVGSIRTHERYGWYLRASTGGAAQAGFGGLEAVF